MWAGEIWKFRVPRNGGSTKIFAKVDKETTQKTRAETGAPGKEGDMSKDKEDGNYGTRWGLGALQ